MILYAFGKIHQVNSGCRSQLPCFFIQQARRKTHETIQIDFAACNPNRNTGGTTDFFQIPDHVVVIPLLPRGEIPGNLLRGKAIVDFIDARIAEAARANGNFFPVGHGLNFFKAMLFTLRIEKVQNDVATREIEVGLVLLIQNAEFFPSQLRKKKHPLFHEQGLKKFLKTADST